MFKGVNIKNNNYNQNKIFKRIGVYKSNEELNFLKTHKQLQILIENDKKLLLQDFNIKI